MRMSMFEWSWAHNVSDKLFISLIMLSRLNEKYFRSATEEEEAEQ